MDDEGELVKQYKGNNEVHVPWSSTKVICSIRMFASSSYLFLGERIALAAAARTPKGINPPHTSGVFWR